MDELLYSSDMTFTDTNGSVLVSGDRYWAYG